MTLIDRYVHDTRRKAKGQSKSLFSFIYSIYECEFNTSSEEDFSTVDTERNTQSLEMSLDEG